MHYSDMNWFDVENYLQNDDRLMLILGACEQHAYLSLLTDIQIPLALADAATQKTNVPVAPPVNFGVSPFFRAFPGTLSLEVETFCRVVNDLVRSAYQQGFRRFLILNGHGGNHPVQETLSELVDDLPESHMRIFSWFESLKVKEVLQKRDLQGYHASWYEAFPFNRVGELPEGTKKPVVIQGINNSKKVKELLGDGSFGGKYIEDEEIMDEIFQAALQDLLDLIQFT